MRKPTIFVVEQGSYSDYRVVGVFTSKKNATLIADAINEAENYGDKATVDEWPVDPAVEDLNAGRGKWSVFMLVDGPVEKCETAAVSGYDLAGSAEIWRRTQAPMYCGKGVPDVLRAMVWADDRQHAIKIVNEIRTEMIATGKWA